ncbi:MULTISPECIES: 3-keto-5-aminohexanoate cleavage protein [unclassified Carboxydocella]|uniref:3-keto-5-aminohexanoate cleavage protein n=1 Tax=unclassified Carboxydocella TaxID=2685367 RepID=UPI0009AC5F0D|nr:MULTISPECIES: 3-keto-5-aminohexanoate cleavage protein [unclassified Carboxydocella]
MEEQNPHLPVTVEESIADIVRVRQAGAAMVHLHVQDEQGRPSQSRELFAKIGKGH